MSQTRHYDAIIIGAGQGGGPLSTALANAGYKTALIEKAHVGGTCVNNGCTPTKTMAASARVAYLSRRAADYGVRTGEISVDMGRVRQRKRDIVESFRSGSLRRIEDTENLDLVRGEAIFVGEKLLEVLPADGDPLRLSGDRIFINTGTRPFIPPIEGLAGVPWLDSTAIMELAEVPQQLIVIGGGYVGLEFAQMFRRFGAQVTVVQRGEQLLPREDSDVAEEIAEILREDGIEVLLDTEASAVECDENGCLQVTLHRSSTRVVRFGTHLLLAAGRRPNSDTLNLSATGVEIDSRGYVKVNERLETTAPGIYALGDVKGGPAFTHISYDDYRILRKNLLDGGTATTRGRLVPYTVFIDPQLGRVGQTEKEAREKGQAIRVAKLPMAHVARALEMDETRGFMKAVVDKNSGQILGCAVLGIEGGEVAGVLQVAMMGKLPYTALRNGVFAHPTLTESLNNLFMTLDA